MPERNPRFEPREGDVLRKGPNEIRIMDAYMGMVFAEPSLSAHRDWVGILHFQRWAADARRISLRTMADYEAES